MQDILVESVDTRDINNDEPAQMNIPQELNMLEKQSN